MNYFLFCLGLNERAEDFFYAQQNNHNLKKYKSNCWKSYSPWLTFSTKTDGKSIVFDVLPFLGNLIDGVFHCFKPIFRLLDKSFTFLK